MTGLVLAELGVNGDARILIPGRPALINSERSGHWRQHRANTSSTRQHGLVAAQKLKTQGYRFPPQAIITSWPVYADRRSWPDVGNWYPTTKAVIDGLVDAGAWPDDNPDHIVALEFHRPELAATTGLIILITPTETTDTNHLGRKKAA